MNDYGLVRVGVGVPALRVADVRYNTGQILALMRKAAAGGCQLVVLPELCVTGYSCADLFYQSVLLNRAAEALRLIAAGTMRHRLAVVVGLPLQSGGVLYNCAALVAEGRIVGVVPKTFLPSTHEFYEDRWFAAERDRREEDIGINGEKVPFGADILFPVDNVGGAKVGIELCEDLWAVSPPSADMALAGATILVNVSASNELLGKAAYRKDLVRQQSARCLAAYAYSSAGPGESTTDTVYSGHSMIAENGQILAETDRFQFDSSLAIADVDVEQLVHERVRSSSFSASAPARRYREATLSLPSRPLKARVQTLLRPIARTPFVPQNRAQRMEHCREIFAIQSVALARRIRHVGTRHVVVGLSGGLDSTLALLVTVKAFRTLKLRPGGIHAYSMPGFGTTARTRGNARRLARLLHASFRTVPIVDSVRQHFWDIGHDESKHDITYENAQARERTQILMDEANRMGGLVVGTGDLSELALGWCTYNGDHMSMYGVNAGIPKTLVRYLVEWCSECEFDGQVSKVLRDICATPITPELLPLGPGGELMQKTESAIGPYELHDFFLFHTVRHQFSPRKVLLLARYAFGDSYRAADILRWMKVFYSRFFSQQFKRSAMPDGPKVGSVALSPRGDWRMPSDASSHEWLREVAALEKELVRRVRGRRVR